MISKCTDWQHRVVSEQSAVTILWKFPKSYDKIYDTIKGKGGNFSITWGSH